MKRKFTLLIAALALLTMIIQPGRAWGQTRDVVTIYSETFGDNGSSNTAYASYNGYSATTAMFTDGQAVKTHYSGDGKVGKNSVDPSNYDDASGLSAAWYTASSGTNTNNILIISGININGYSDLSLSFGMLKKNGTNTTNVTSVSYKIDNSDYQSFSFTHPTDASWHLITGDLSGTGESLTIKFVTNTSGGFTTRYDDIKVTGTSSSLTPSITASNVQMGCNAQGTSIHYEIGNYVAGTMTAATEATWITNLQADPDFEYPNMGSIEVTTTINESVSPRSATVTLTYTYGTKATVTKNVTVTQAGNPNAPGSQNDPYTVAEARSAIDAGIGTQGVYATGIVYQVDSYNSTYHSITYWISDDGTSTNPLEVYGGLGIDDETNQFTSINDIQVNDIVVVRGNLTKFNSTYEFAQNNRLISLVRNPYVTATPSPFTAPSYSAGTANPTTANLTVTGSNLTADITATLNDNSNFQIKDGENWVSTITLTQSQGSVNGTIAIRLKPGLAVGSYNGTITLSTTGTDNVVVNLNGSVSSAMYDIVVTQPVTGGTIAADKETASEGETVTLTATPNAGYDFGSWSVLKDDMVTPIAVENNQFTMPDCDVLVTATFTAKPTYAVTCVATPDNTGLLESTPTSAYQGQTVTLEYTAETGYTFSSIVITKTSDGSATGITPAVSGDDFIFTMPSYPVTVTATFLTNTYEGTFALYSGDLIEGDYILVYDGKALKNTVNNSRFGIQSVTPSNYTISDPLRSIVWHIAPSETDGYWTIYNAIAGLYANGTQNSTNVSLGDDPTATTAIWAVSGTYDFRCKANEGQSTARYLRYHGSNQVFGNYAPSNGGALTLYKYTVLTERTITFNGNGGTYNDETTYTQTVYDGIAANLIANKFSKANSEFAGWAQTAEGDIIYADQAEVTINADLGLYAKWSTFYNITVDNSIEGGSVSIDGSITSAVEGTEITLSYSPTAGHAFSAWNVYKTGDPATTLTVTDNKFSMPAYDVTVSASFVEATTYSLITDASQIVSGKHYLIVGYKNTTAYAMGYDKGNNRSAVEVNINNNIILETAGVYEFVINNSDVNWIIYDKNTQNLNANNTYGFLYAAGGSGSNYLKTRATNNDNKGIWTISIADQTNVATVTALSTGRNNMRFNDGNSPLFACYASPTDQSDIYLFVKDNDNDFEFYGDVTYTETSIPAGETLTVTAGSVMTITNNSFANNDSDNLIIEEGGQLVVPTDANVQATVKKAVGHAAKSTGDWYTISSPVKNVDPASVTNLIQATPANYDFYYYNEPSGEWFNHKAAGHNVGTMTNGRGYLYWNADGDELAFAGELNTGSVEVAVTAGGSGDLKGINLIGNPYSHNIYKGAGTAIPNTGGALATGFYMLSNSDSWVACTDNTTAIKPAQGILVKATEAGTVTMTNTTAAGTSKAGNDNIRFTVANNQYEDVAYAMFNNEIGLNKINHRNPEVPMLYIPQDGTNYAIATMSDDVEMFTLSFKTVTTSKYTLRVKLDGKYDYLHIVDRLTGEDIDMLAEGEYSFMGTPKDLVDRFIVKLKYDANINDVNDIFAYQSGSDVIVNGEGELQIFDLMGRKVMTQVVNGVQTVNVPAQGVYIFRLNGKVQKIVVR